ncbi:MAG: Uma2 family endonuclease [Gemmataceae bacterium]
MSEAATKPEQRTHDAWSFRYGYRLVKREVRPGRCEIVEVPLTREQYLHPEVEDRFMVKPRHVAGSSFVAAVLEAALNSKPVAVVLSEVDVNFGHGIRAMRPDVTFLTHLKGPIPGHRCPLDLPSLGAVPTLVLEVTYALTRDADLEDKVHLYHRGGVRHYLIVDLNVEAGVPQIQFVSYRWTPERFVRKKRIEALEAAADA